MTERRVILHSDMNSFYASVEMMLDPSLKGKPVAVCGATEERHGIVLAKSDLAKKAGVKTGMVNWEAKQRCPGLIFVPPQYDQYLKYSKLAHEIYYRYTDQVEPFGMDECWLDVTGSSSKGTGMEIAEKIRTACREELGLTVSIGVSFNKIFAQQGFMLTFMQCLLPQELAGGILQLTDITHGGVIHDPHRIGTIRCRQRVEQVDQLVCGDSSSRSRSNTDFRIVQNTSRLLAFSAEYPAPHLHHPAKEAAPAWRTEQQYTARIPETTVYLGIWKCTSVQTLH